MTYPYVDYGAQGGFFSAIGRFVGRAAGQIIHSPISQAVASLGGPVGRVVSTVAAHPLTTAVAGAAAGTALVAATGGHRGVIAAPVMPGGMRPGVGGGLSITTPGGLGIHLHGYHMATKGRHAGQMVKNRRMNVCNSRALRRALRRAHGFEKLAMRTIHLLHPRKKAKFGGFKKRTRASARA